MSFVFFLVLKDLGLCISVMVMLFFGFVGVVMGFYDFIVGIEEMYFGNSIYVVVMFVVVVVNVVVSVMMGILVDCFGDYCFLIFYVLLFGVVGFVFVYFVVSVFVFVIVKFCLFLVFGVLNFFIFVNVCVVF